MLQYLSPGVYVRESEPSSHLIKGVDTDIAAFIGFSEKAQKIEKINGEVITTDLLCKPQRIESWLQYREWFGGFVEGAYMPLAVYGYFQNNDGASPCYVLSLCTMPHAEALLFGADGKPQLKVRAKQAGTEGAQLRVRVEKAELRQITSSEVNPEGQISEKGDSLKKQALPSLSLIIEKESPSGQWQKEPDIEEITIETALGSEKKIIRFNQATPELLDLKVLNQGVSLATLLPRPQQQRLRMTDDFLLESSLNGWQGEQDKRTGLAGLSAINEITMLCLPDLMISHPGQQLDLNMVATVQNMVIAHCERMGDRVAILDSPPQLLPQKIKRWRMDQTAYDSSFAVLYYPWIEVNDPMTNRPIYIPPSGHIAGIWSRNDRTVGVHKAPANEVIRGATGLAVNVIKGEQEILNPVGINCLRALPGLGIRVWGARTLSSRSEWRYINVRRLFNFVKKSIEQGTDWITFEPNNQELWAKIRREVTDFLTREVWQKGMLAGASPQEAFIVKCDEELNHTKRRDLGELMIEIALAPLRPAEFIIFRLLKTVGPGAEK